MKLSRRTFAKSAGAGLILAPFYNLLRPRRALAAPGARRLLIFHSQPCDTGTWNPSNVTGESSFTLPAMLDALNEIKQHIVLVDGLAPKQPGDNHYSPHALTGVGREGRPDKGNISIEQYIGDQLEKTRGQAPDQDPAARHRRQVGGGVLPEQHPADHHRLAPVGLQHRVLGRRHGRVAERAAAAAQEHPRRGQGRRRRAGGRRWARARSRSSSCTSSRSASSSSGSPVGCRAVR